MTNSSTAALALSLMAVAFLGTGLAADGANDTKSAADAAAQIAALKAQFVAQQKQIEQLQTALQAEMKLLDQVAANTATPAARVVPVVPVGTAAAPLRLQSLGEVASSVPMLPAAPAAVTPPRIFPPAPQQPAATEVTSPLQLQIGNTTIMPVGFMDLTAYWRSTDAGGSIGSNFGNIPYNNAATAKLSEMRFSPQNSRIGFRVDGNWSGTHFLAYNEMDFLGTSGTNNLSVTNGAFVPRLRLFWVDLRKGQWEMLAGQSWSMLTPNRRGISALPGDIFYSQVMDVNYMAGLTWTRQPGVRVLFHPSDQVTWGLSLENPDAYMGGSGGGSSITLPSTLSGLAGTQLDNASNVQTVPNLHPDIISKIAIDPNSRVHFEFGGIERTFKIWNTTTGTPTSGDYSTNVGGGVLVGGNFEIAKNFRLITTNFWSDGGGRYLFGQAPDLVVRANGTISPLHAGGTVDGFETNVSKNMLLFGYYGGIYIGRDVALDVNGTSLIGYGYHGAANSQNKDIQEITFGFNQTMWKDAKYGAINLIGQYDYLLRAPWYWAAGVAGGKGTHDDTIYMDIRYTLPGSAPSVK
jgi:hypothetical protein